PALRLPGAGERAAAPTAQLGRLGEPRQPRAVRERPGGKAVDAGRGTGPGRRAVHLVDVAHRAAEHLLLCPAMRTPGRPVVRRPRAREAAREAVELDGPDGCRAE